MEWAQDTASRTESKEVDNKEEEEAGETKPESEEAEKQR